MDVFCVLGTILDAEDEQWTNYGAKILVAVVVVGDNKQITSDGKECWLGRAGLGDGATLGKQKNSVFCGDVGECLFGKEALKQGPKCSERTHNTDI